MKRQWNWLLCVGFVVAVAGLAVIDDAPLNQ